MGKKNEAADNGRLRPASVVRGPFSAEAIRIISVVRERESVKVTGLGMKTGKVQEFAIKPSQLVQIESVAESAEGAPGAPSLSAPPLGELKYYYLSQLLKSRVRFEGERKPFGRLYDIGAKSITSYAHAVCLEVKSRAHGIIFIPWPATVQLGLREILVRKEPMSAPAVDFWLRRDVLDDQVVDVTGMKVLRVNDVHMLHAEGQLIAAHVEVGILGLLRRLGLEMPIRASLRWLLDYTIKDSFVSWPKVEVVSPGGSPGGLRVSGAASRLAGIHPAELADILEQLGVKERQTLFRTLSVETAAGALGEVEREVQRSLIAQEEPGKAAEILEEMSTKEAADVLRDLDSGEVERIMRRMEREAADDIKILLAHSKKTAGGIMATSCIEARPDQRAAEVIDHVRSMTGEAEIFNHIYVLDETRHLLGLLSLRELLGAAPDATVESLMTKQLVKVSPGTGLQDVARLFVKYGFRAIPVVDRDNVFLGAVRLYSALSELSPLFRE